MKKFYSITATLFLLFSSFYSKAQPTTLAAGDIVIVGWNSVDNVINTGGSFSDDDIDFVLLKNINANTEIYFTDLGWTGTGFQGNQNGGCAVNTGAASDGCIKWTSTSSLPAGTQIRIAAHYSLSATTGTVSVVLNSAGGPAGPGGTFLPHLSLSTSSDEIFAFQGSLAAPTFIAAVHYGGLWAGALTTCQFTSSQSLNPGCGGFSFLYTSTLNNNRYTGSLTGGNMAAFRASVLNAANWSGNDITSFIFPISVSFLITLPVKVSNFDAKRTDLGNILEWKVENEDNFSQYEVETSSNGTSYTNIGTVKAAGHKTYTFSASATQSSYQLYRLKLVDLNGKFEYSKIVRIDNAVSKVKAVVFPNPAYNSIAISSADPITSLSLSDITGKKCLQQKVDNSNSTTVDIGSLKPGVYMLTIVTKSGTQIERIYKKDN